MYKQKLEHRQNSKEEHYVGWYWA